jgi:hypothetical protein
MIRASDEWKAASAIDQVEEASKEQGKKEPDNYRPTEDQPVMTPVAASHARQQIIAMFFFVFARPKHNASSGQGRIAHHREHYSMPGRLRHAILEFMKPSADILVRWVARTDLQRTRMSALRIH